MPDRRFVALLALALVGGAATAFAQDEPSPGERLIDVETRLGEAREEQQLYAEDVSALTVRLAELSRELIERAAEVRRIEANVLALDHRLAELNAAEAEKMATLAARKDSLAAMVSGLLNLARRPPEALIAMPGTLADVRHTGILLASLVPRVDAEAASLDAELRALADLRMTVAERQGAHAAAVTALAEERERVAALMAETAELRAQRLDERQIAARRAADLAAEAADLRALITMLAKGERAKQPDLPEGALGRVGTGKVPLPAAKPEGMAAAIVAEAEPAPEPASAEAKSVAVVPLAPVPIMPVVGDVTRRFGEAGEDGQASRGMVMAATAGAQVVAPRDGEVVYAGRFKNLGELLIIDHGDEYHSVLAGFARIDAAVGQRVSVGEPVGVMGDAQGAMSLYFELRRAGEPVDPLPWLSTAQNEDSQ